MRVIRFLIIWMMLIGTLIAKEDRVNLAWLGYLKLPKKTFEAKQKVDVSSPLKWKAWRHDEGGAIQWIPRYKGHVDVLGRSLKVLPKGPDIRSLPRRKQHQLAD